MELFKFLKVGQSSRSRGHNSEVPIERSCHKQHTYEIPTTYQSKDDQY
jgi:hypothetical protein